MGGGGGVQGNSTSSVSGVDDLISVGKVEAMFNVKAQGLEICFDPSTEQQMLSFKLALHVSLPQLLQQLLNFQQYDGTAGGAAAAASAGGGGGGGGGGKGGLGGTPPSTIRQMAGDLAALATPLEMLGSGYGHQIGGRSFPGTGMSSDNSLTPMNIALNQAGSGSQLGAQRQQHQQQQQQQQHQGQGQGQGGQSHGMVPPPGIPFKSSLQGQGDLPHPPGALNKPMNLGQVSRMNFNSPAEYEGSSGTGPAAAWSQLQSGSAPAACTINSSGSAGIGMSEVARNEALMLALNNDDVAQARLLLQQRADVNWSEGQHQITPLHQAVMKGGSLDAVNLLLKGSAHVNALNSHFQTPLHIAISNFKTIPPLAIRMLLCNQADLSVKDLDGVTPLDNMRLLSVQAAQHSSEGAAHDHALRVRQILDEVTELPTIDIGVVDGQKEVLSAHFADTLSDRVVFNTDSSIGMYSLHQRRIIFMKKLKQQQVQSAVRHISVNPELGTIAVCLELTEPGPGGSTRMSNVFIIWPSGKLQDSEPLKLSINVGPNPQGFTLPACAMLSRSAGPQFLLGRLVDGKVFSWSLNNERTQLQSEAALASEGALAVSTSDDGFWIAIVVYNEGSCTVNVWSYLGVNGFQREPSMIYSDYKSPQCITIQQADGGTAHMATVDKCAEGMPLPPIEVRSISIQGSSKILYRLKVPSPCRSLSFCHGVVTHVFSGHNDGLAVLYDLVRGTTSQAHGNPLVSSLSISTDRNLIVSTEQHCFRIFRVSAASPAT